MVTNNHVPGFISDSGSASRFQRLKGGRLNQIENGEEIS